MGKFHISEDGNPRPCTAQVCPLGGGEEDHIVSDSMDEVRRFAEQVNTTRYEAFASFSKSKQVETGFGSEDEREEKLSAALDFQRGIWEHPLVGHVPPRDRYLEFYKDHLTEHRNMLADSFEVSPKHVYLAEELAVIEKDGKFLVLSPLSAHAEGVMGRSVGMELTEARLREDFEEEEYSLSEDEESSFREFIAARSEGAAGAATSGTSQEQNQALMAEVRDTFNYELSEFDGTDYDESLPVPSKAKANEVANRMLTMLEREELSEDDTMDMIVALSAANSEDRLDGPTTERGHAVVDGLIRRGKVQRGFHPYGVFGAAED